MIITISGEPGSGKSVVAKALAKKLGLKHYSAGDFMREMAEKRKMSILELTNVADKDPSIDREIDERTKQLAKQDNFIIDSRLAFKFIPSAAKIFLKVDSKIAAERIFNARRQDEEENITLAKTEQNIIRRLHSEQGRYKKLYKIDYLDEKNYDLVINTSKSTVEEITDKIVEFLRKI